MKAGKSILEIVPNLLINPFANSESNGLNSSVAMPRKAIQDQERQIEESQDQDQLQNPKQRSNIENSESQRREIDARNLFTMVWFNGLNSPVAMSRKAKATHVYDGTGASGRDGHGVEERS